MGGDFNPLQMLEVGEEAPGEMGTCRNIWRGQASPQLQPMIPLKQCVALREKKKKTKTSKNNKPPLKNPSEHSQSIFVTWRTLPGDVWTRGSL